MPNNSPATPLPWVYENINGLNKHGFPAHLHRIADSSNVAVTSLDDTHPQDNKDAAYIVQACNAYPQLVEALRLIAAREAIKPEIIALETLRSLGENV